MKIEIEITDEEIKKAVISEAVSWHIRDEVREHLRICTLTPFIKEVLREKIEDAISHMDTLQMKEEVMKSLESQLKAAVKKAFHLGAPI